MTHKANAIRDPALVRKRFKTAALAPISNDDKQDASRARCGGAHQHVVPLHAFKTPNGANHDTVLRQTKPLARHRTQRMIARNINAIRDDVDGAPRKDARKRFANSLRHSNNMRPNKKPKRARKQPPPDGFIMPGVMLHMNHLCDPGQPRR